MDARGGFSTHVQGHLIPIDDARFSRREADPTQSRKGTDGTNATPRQWPDPFSFLWALRKLMGWQTGQSDKLRKGEQTSCVPTYFTLLCTPYLIPTSGTSSWVSFVVHLLANNHPRLYLHILHSGWSHGIWEGASIFGKSMQDTAVPRPCDPPYVPP